MVKKSRNSQDYYNYLGAGGTPAVVGKKRKK